MVNKKELKQRAIYVYPPAHMAENWKTMATQSNTSISKFVIEHVENLSTFPMMGRVYPDLDDENTREIFFKKYRILYRIKESMIEIITIFHGSRDYKPKV